MRVELGFFEDYEGCEIGPDTILRDVRPYGRRVTWKEEGSPTIWHTFIPEDEYDEDTYDVEKLTGVALPEEFYRLPYDPAWTEFKGPLHSNQFLKAVKVRDYDPYETKPTWPVNEHKEEIMIYEELKSHPHPSIVRYHGVLVEDGFVTGIVLDKLDEDVYGAVGQPAKKSHIWTVDKVIKDIKEGLDHLHSLGIMHGDVSLSNIMLDTTGRAVLIDFDSAFHIGEGRYGKLSHALYRHITDKYSRPTADGTNEPYACIEVDLDCLALTQRELIELDERRIRRIGSQPASADSHSEVLEADPHDTR